MRIPPRSGLVYDPKEYAGASNKERLLSLRLPVQRAAERCGGLRAMVDAHEIFHPIRWSPAAALRQEGAEQARAEAFRPGGAAIA